MVHQSEIYNIMCRGQEQAGDDTTVFSSVFSEGYILKIQQDGKYKVSFRGTIMPVLHAELLAGSFASTLELCAGSP